MTELNLQLISSVDLKISTILGDRFKTFGTAIWNFFDENYLNQVFPF